MTSDCVIRIAGESGEGIVLAGEIVTLALSRAGFNIFTFRTYPAEVRGGPSLFQIRAGAGCLRSQGDSLDILVSLNDEARDGNLKDLKEGSVLLWDGTSDVQWDSPADKDILSFPIPITEIVSREVGVYRCKNMVAIGALCNVLHFDYSVLESVIQEKTSKKGRHLLEKNLLAYKLGFDYVETHKTKSLPCHLSPIGKSEKLSLSGNEALALGALMSGCRFYAAYPITPATDLMEWLALELPRIGGTVIQAEDEMSALGMVLGASFVGQKAFTATSGPGLSLMAELIGMACMAEIPSVIVDVQRGGPSTGMPTKTEQSDLNLALYGTHGDSPRIVLAPTNVEDCFYQIMNAFNLSEKYQVPVIVLSDQSLGHRKESVRRPVMADIKRGERLRPKGDESKDYRRYRLTPSGVSPMAIPGEDEGYYVAQGLEHDEYGAPCYDPENHLQMTTKRFCKLQDISDDIALFKRYGKRDARIGIIGWGSTEGAVREAFERLNTEGYPVEVFYPQVLNPLPDKEIRNFLENKKSVLVPEINYTGQFSMLLRGKYLKQVTPLTICGGVPFTVKEIYSKVRELCDT
ncbi:MAG: 2-oxoacid:acceptor oxidoreductase subunit alpha [Candidatus Scalindua sp. AMX11]|nr:MAG: 2-oxoacid:acceptor oxidoreductase subunit alpha [Candidatus Scalindua sp.]NOG84767.1 2-oxoacid:acceptor oxidoreductase subunit alpha [Planctomycetota bacterium]RZV98369.1 MAG: 2-oxoacid:acceptor oxidoreductase subunit alpha [Candidatus Scalindua sp. SCAELEC01]TDE66538.1 MAG: 2-oxoacid:acceptor oxidoreductase subunit alpha [Candidatus Scalindua sp. AMX11]GJQ58903.1 MAG: pyruvate ferredoxin oxidoreductase [Candidatus Scalindua sp.]